MFVDRQADEEMHSGNTMSDKVITLSSHLATHDFVNDDVDDRHEQ